MGAYIHPTALLECIHCGQIPLNLEWADKRLTVPKVPPDKPL